MSQPEPVKSPRRWPLIGAIAVLCAVVATIVVVNVSNHAEAESSVADDGTVSVSAGFDDCGAGWDDPRGGALSFSVTNSTIAGVDMYLEGAHDEVYGEVEGLGTNAQRRLDVVLGDGSYHFVCVPAESDPIQGPTVTIEGALKRDDLTPGIELVTRADLLPAVKQYQGWIESRLPVLDGDARSLDAAVASGDLNAAKSAWLTTHLEYESLGAAYDAFGDADAAINGEPAPGLTAATDPALVGLHKIESQLWSGAPAGAIAPFTAQLVTAVDTLNADFVEARINALDIGLRAHEIIENAIQFELPGDTDAGSHTNLATIGANLVGSKEALAPLESTLSTRYPDLAKTKEWLDRSAALIAGYQRPDGSWTPIGDLSQSQRATLNSTLDQTVELLAPIAAICDPRTGDK